MNKYKTFPFVPGFLLWTVLLWNPGPVSSQLLQEPVQSSQPVVSWGRYTVETIPDSFTPLSGEEAFILLDKVEKALEEHAELTPLELVQGAWLLITRGNPLLTHRLARMLLQRFNQDDEVSEKTLFEIVDHAGRAQLTGIVSQRELAPESDIAIERLLFGYNEYLKRFEGVEGVLLWKTPVSAWEKINAANQVSKGGRLEIAKVLLKQFWETEATPEELAEIREKLGTNDLLRLATFPGLQPEGQHVAQRLIVGITQDPGTSSPLPDAEFEESEYFDDKNALAVLLQQGDTANLARIAGQLSTQILSEEAYLLYPALFDPQVDSQTRTEIAGLVRHLTGRIPTEREAALTLFHVAKDYQDKRRKLSQNEEDETALWTFNPEVRRLKLQTVPILHGYLKMFVRFATAAYNIDPTNSEIRTLYYIALCEQTVVEVGQDKPIDVRTLDFFEQLSLDDLETILAESLQNGYTRSGVLCAQQLGHIGTVETALLPKQDTQHATRQARSGTPRILVQATTVPDRRIRFAALEAIMRLGPQSPYPGSSLVSDALVWFASAEGKRLAVVGTPKIADGMELVGRLASLGYEGKVATTNKDVFHEASRTPDVEIVLIDERMQHPFPPIFAQTMRKDIRTSEIPIAILSKNRQVLDATPIETPFRLQSTWERETSNTTFADSLSMILPYPRNPEVTGWVVQHLLDLTGAETVPASLRLKESQQALLWLAQINRESPHLYRVENLARLAFQTAFTPALAENGIALLATIRSKEAQQQLVELAIGEVAPEIVRIRATAAFEQNVQSFGLLLRDRDRERLWRQYQTQDNPFLDSIIETMFGMSDSNEIIQEE